MKRFVLFLAVFLFSASAFSQPTSEQIGRAQSHFEKGAELYFDAQYEQAIDQFRAAQAVVPNPIFLYNIALAFLKLGKENDAMFHAREARRTGLAGTDAVRNDARIAALSTGVRARAVAKAPPTQISEPDPVRDGGFSVLPDTVYGWVGVGAAGVGILALATFGIFELTLASKIDEYENTDDPVRFDELKSDIESQQTISRIALISGGVLLVTGATLYATDKLGLWDQETQVGLKLRGDGIAVFGTF